MQVLITRINLDPGQLLLVWQLLYAALLIGLLIFLLKRQSVKVTKYKRYLVLAFMFLIVAGANVPQPNRAATISILKLRASGRAAGAFTPTRPVLINTEINPICDLQIGLQPLSTSSIQVWSGLTGCTLGVAYKPVTCVQTSDSAGIVGFTIHYQLLLKPEWLNGICQVPLQAIDAEFDTNTLKGRVLP